MFKAKNYLYQCNDLPNQNLSVNFLSLYTSQAFFIHVEDYWNWFIKHVMGLLRSNYI